MSWDQFTANEKLFGVKASFDEDVYTTKLDRSAPDFKERERRAQKLANEIVAAATSNPHVAEERGLAVDDSGVNEEDKYVFTNGYSLASQLTQFGIDMARLSVVQTPTSLQLAGLPALLLRLLERLQSPKPRFQRSPLTVRMEHLLRQ